MNNMKTLLKKIQALEFTAVDLNLYLDTHPQDQAALRHFCTVRDELLNCIRTFEQKYGPLTPVGYACTNCWQWVESPWPWEIEYD
jgi:spore coat protein JB